MTPEKLVPEIVRQLRTGVWPETAKAGIIISEETDACGEWYHPLWLAQMVVGWIQDREKQYASVGYSVPGYFVENPGPIFIHVYGGNEPLKLALRDFSISKEDYEWLKGKVENGKK